MSKKIFVCFVAVVTSRCAPTNADSFCRYASVEEARAGAKVMYHDDRVLLIADRNGSGSGFVDWIER